MSDALALPGWIRLVLAGVAVVHALLCVRVVVMRVTRRNEPGHPERVPTAAMVAYGILTANIAWTLLSRIPNSTSLRTETITVFVPALLAGTIAFTQIVFLTRRERRREDRARTRR